MCCYVRFGEIRMAQQIIPPAPPDLPTEALSRSIKCGFEKLGELELVKTVPIFSGDSSADFLPWTQAIHRVITCFPNSGIDFRNLAYFRSSGAVRKFIQHFLANNSTSGDFSGALLARFGPCVDKGLALSKLIAIKQHTGERLELFADRLQLTANDAFGKIESNLAVIQQQLANLFINGINDSRIKTHVVRNDPKDLKSAVDFATQERRVLTRINELDHAPSLLTWNDENANEITQLPRKPCRTSYQDSRERRHFQSQSCLQVSAVNRVCFRCGCICNIQHKHRDNSRYDYAHKLSRDTGTHVKKHNRSKIATKYGTAKINRSSCGPMHLNNQDIWYQRKTNNNSAPATHYRVTSANNIRSTDHKTSNVNESSINHESRLSDIHSENLKDRISLHAEMRTLFTSMKLGVQVIQLRLIFWVLSSGLCVILVQVSA